MPTKTTGVDICIAIYKITVCLKMQLESLDTHAFDVNITITDVSQNIITLSFNR